MASSNNRMSREESKKAKEIEEMRKAGTLAPEVDEDGNMINPHIPLYMSQAPWYLNATEGSGLKHQKDNKDRTFLMGGDARQVKNNWKQNKKGVGRGRDEFGDKINPNKPKKKRGEVEEEEAPRDTGYTESYDGKHDRWNGWDNSQYKEVIDRYEMIEAERRKKKAQEVDEKFKRKAMRKEEKRKKKELKRKLKEKKLKAKQDKAKSGDDTDGTDSDSDSDSDDSDSDDDDMKMVEDISMGAGFDNHEGGSKGIRTTVRNLRIREDTAKYLYNLDPSSAYYDPKTRSMRADPRPHLDAKDKLYAGDNMRKASGETGDFTNEQLYAWEASQRGQNLTMEAAPSAAHFMHKKFESKKESLADRQKRLLAEKYGNAASDAPDTALLLGQSEQYVQYGRDGRIIKGADKVVPKTKYAEDVLIGNHSKTWGSFFDKTTRRWGFACCQQTSRQAYCVPLTKQTISDAEAMPPPPALPAGEVDDTLQQPGEMMEAPAKLSKKEQREKEKKEKEESDERLKKALAKEKKLAKKGKDDDDFDDKKRKYNSMKSTDVTEEDMEAYKMAKMRDDDPMAKFL